MRDTGAFGQRPAVSVRVGNPQQTIIKVSLTLLLIPAGALILGWTFLLKMMSHMQSRLGPMDAGPHGVLQLVADGVKFIQKEDIFPDRADRRVFALAPFV